jgi:hypothetical protein
MLTATGDERSPLWDVPSGDFRDGEISVATRLKVFSANMGFFETVVAAPSQKAALAAWGTRQNLFGEGMAKLAEDPKIVAQALAAPGKVLRRAVGSKGAFAVEAAAPRAPRAKRKTNRPSPDRSKLTKAERARDTATARFERARADLEQRRDELQSRIDGLARTHEDEIARLEETLRRVRANFRAAGGVA